MVRNCAHGDLDIVLQLLDSGFDASHRPGMTADWGLVPAIYVCKNRP
jgi:hypothetical protein